MKSGGVYVNNVKTGSDASVTLADSVDGKFIVLRRGKKTYHLVQVKE